MIDFHSHILPSFDDGAKDIATSIKMLKNAYNDGISTVVSTSHAYIINDGSIDSFLVKREKAYSVLRKAMEADGGDFPEILLGAEVHIKSYLSNINKLDSLAIEGTNYILIEMPYSAWRQEHYESVYNCTVCGLKPIIAHADRYIERENKFHHLKAFGAIFQINADSFLTKSLRKRLLSLFYNGYAHILGSDMHNLEERKNRMKEACGIISELYDDKFLDFVTENGRCVLNNEPVFDRELPKLPVYKRIKL